jgi:small subunit ribosomal protein S20
MPVTKSAIKALRQQKKRTIRNAGIRAKMRTIIKAVKTGGGAESLSEMYSTVDRAAKRGIIHPNKAARIKSRITKSVAGVDQPVISTPAKAKAKPAKKAAAKAKPAAKKATKKTTAKKVAPKAKAKPAAKKAKKA